MHSQSIRMRELCLSCGVQFQIVVQPVVEHCFSYNTNKHKEMYNKTIGVI